MPSELQSRVGFEIELLTPRGSSRADLAAAIAAGSGGRVERAFHRDSEPSAVPGMGSFRHLTPAFDVVDAEGAPVCSVVDDVTIVAGLDVRAVPAPGWYRMLTDDARLLNLLAGVCDPQAEQGEVLKPVAALFGTEVLAAGPSIFRVVDRDGASVAMAAPLPGERERPAEIITPPLERDHAAALDRLLGPARALGCAVPVEAAVHLHLDAAPFRAPRAFANVVALFGRWRPALWRLLGTNPACRRLAAPPQALLDRVDALRGLGTWAEVPAALADVELTKYSDVNLLHVLRAPRVKDTLEVRILPGADAAEAIVERAALVEGLLRLCVEEPDLPHPPTGRVEEDTATLERWGRGRR
ncbi:amidoligase family protein [Pseudonocardia humida]|uniref:Amidoligase family protein n=1 Tax=Pseudonocardia humida TaxID=2800819 RepID=A0ABT0ZZN6_9PSEU|nr:amidoligase family protein [Pseudonocardia humida]MCO1656215.1 amidoligase family protein [Pseudonocardia humida]